MHPQRGPRRPQQPIFDTFLRGGLHCEHYTTSSPNLTATRLGELHDMRVRHAGDTLCDGFVSCKTPTTGGVEGAGRTVHPAGAPASAKNSPSTAPPGLIREKVRPASTKTTNLGCFKRAGRTFSRFHDLTATQGELFRACRRRPSSALPISTPGPTGVEGTRGAEVPGRGAGCGRLAEPTQVRRATARQISHIIPHGHFSRPPENVAIPTI